MTYQIQDLFDALAPQKESETQAVLSLIDKKTPADLAVHDRAGLTVLYRALLKYASAKGHEGDREIILKLIDKGADLNQKMQNADEHTPMFLACVMSNDKNFIDLLIERGGLLNAPNCRGRRPWEVENLMDSRMVDHIKMRAEEEPARLAQVALLRAREAEERMIEAPILIDPASSKTKPLSFKPKR